MMRFTRRRPQLFAAAEDHHGSAFIQVPAITVAVNKNLAGYTFYPVYVQDMSTVYYTK